MNNVVRYGFIVIFGMVMSMNSNPWTARAQEIGSASSDVHWWQTRVWYEIFVRSFKDSDGDGIGDIQGVISQLDYLSQLGISGIWLMPVTPSPSYHGYDVTDYESIETDYGTMEDFRMLLAAAHERGIAVIIDLVMNHTSSQHPWFRASAERDPVFDDWYRWETTAPSYLGTFDQAVWHHRGGRSYYGFFWSEMPDLNLTNPTVTEAIYETAHYWMEDVGVDGFRLDAIKYLIEDDQVLEDTPQTVTWLRDFNTYVSGFAPDKFIVGEAWSSSYLITDYVDQDAVDLVFEFDLAQAMISSAVAGSAADVLSIQSRAMELFPTHRFAAFLTNHDQNRAMSELRGDVATAKVAATLLLTNPGVPFVYYGEEIGMVGVKPDERIRTPMQWDNTPRTAGFTTARRPWQPLSEGNEDGVNVANQDADADSLLNHYRALIALRNAHPALQTGDYVRVETGSSRVYAFVRQGIDESILVIVNMNWRAQTAEDYRLMLESGILTGAAMNVLFASPGIEPASVELPTVSDMGGFTDYHPLAELPPRTTIILSLR